MTIEEELRIHRELALLLLDYKLRNAVNRRAALNRATATIQSNVGAGVWIPTIKGMLTP